MKLKNLFSLQILKYNFLGLSCSILKKESYLSKWIYYQKVFYSSTISLVCVTIFLIQQTSNFMYYVIIIEIYFELTPHYTQGVVFTFFNLTKKNILFFY
jgi:hypothetical protein